MGAWGCWSPPPHAKPGGNLRAEPCGGGAVVAAFPPGQAGVFLLSARTPINTLQYGGAACQPQWRISTNVAACGVAWPVSLSNPDLVLPLHFTRPRDIVRRPDVAYFGVGPEPSGA